MNENLHMPDMRLVPILDLFWLNIKTLDSSSYCTLVTLEVVLLRWKQQRNKFVI